MCGGAILIKCVGSAPAFLPCSLSLWAPETVLKSLFVLVACPLTTLWLNMPMAMRAHNNYIHELLVEANDDTLRVLGTN